MDLQIAGKRALITGGSRGIGRAIADVLAGEGCDLVLVARDVTALEAAANAIRARGQGDVRVIPADLSIEADVMKVAKASGEIDILVNNAGAVPTGNLMQVDNEAWRKGWDLKVFGYISLSREIYPGMSRRKSGVIINIMGWAGERFPSGFIAGAAGNAALMGFTRSLARAAHADGIRVLGINPGAVATERHERIARGLAEERFGDPERWRDIDKELPFGRAGHPDEIANTVAFFASPRSGYTSGTILAIDGGHA